MREILCGNSLYYFCFYFLPFAPLAILQSEPLLELLDTGHCVSFEASKHFIQIKHELNLQRPNHARAFFLVDLVIELALEDVVSSQSSEDLVEVFGVVSEAKTSEVGQFLQKEAVVDENQKGLSVELLQFEIHFENLAENL